MSRSDAGLALIVLRVILNNESPVSFEVLDLLGSSRFITRLSIGPVFSLLACPRVVGSRLAAFTVERAFVCALK